MQVRNVHARTLPLAPGAVGLLIDSLGSTDDRLWPGGWPAMRLDRPLGPGARGGHGPIRYVVERYQRGRRVVFRFTAPAGFDGTHGFAAVPVSDDEATRLVHSLEMRTRGLAVLSWPLVYGPLHDALIEDSLDRAERELGLGPPAPARWSPWVRFLQWVLERAGNRR